MFKVILKSLNSEDERIVLAEHPTKDGAEGLRRQWRKVLGNRWNIDRRPGLDTVDHLALTVEN